VIGHLHDHVRAALFKGLVRREEMEPWLVSHVIPIAMSLTPGDLRTASHASRASPIVGIAPLPKALARGTNVGRSRSWRSRLTPSTSCVVAITRSTIYAALGERAGTVAPRQHRQPTADRSDHHDF
jgi:hypothetical protein